MDTIIRAGRIGLLLFLCLALFSCSAKPYLRIDHLENLEIPLSPTVIRIEAQAEIISAVEELFSKNNFGEVLLTQSLEAKYVIRFISGGGSPKGRDQSSDPSGPRPSGDPKSDRDDALAQLILLGFAAGYAFLGLPYPEGVEANFTVEVYSKEKGKLSSDPAHYEETFITNYYRSERSNEKHRQAVQGRLAQFLFVRALLFIRRAEASAAQEGG